MTRRLPDILAARQRPVLSRFAATNLLVALDFDGTLAPIVPRPESARMPASTRRLLRLVAHRYPCIVVSGRRLADVSRRLRGLPLRGVFGTYGYEPAAGDARPPQQVPVWARHLADRLGGVRGIVIEEKTHSVTVHYRHAADRRRALVLAQRAVGELTDLRVLRGPYAVVLLPRRGPDKGTAVQGARRALGCDAAIYVGDDGTDEAAFASDTAERLLPVRVGQAHASHARYRLRRQADIDRLLEVLMALRPGGRGAVTHALHQGAPGGVT